MTGKGTLNEELEALGTVLTALEPLDQKQRQFIIRTVVDRLDIPISTSPDRHGSKQDAAGGSSSGAGARPPAPLDGVSAKEFLRLKKPQTDLQRIVCLAYCLANGRQQQTFKTLDLTKVNTEAAGGKLSNPINSMSVSNATNQSRFFAPAGKGGLKQLTALGEEYVNALPDQEGARAVVESHKVRREKSAKKKSAKK